MTGTVYLFLIITVNYVYSPPTSKSQKNVDSDSCDSENRLKFSEIP